MCLALHSISVAEALEDGFEDLRQDIPTALVGVLLLSLAGVECLLARVTTRWLVLPLAGISLGGLIAILRVLLPLPGGLLMLLVMLCLGCAGMLGQQLHQSLFSARMFDGQLSLGTAIASSAPLTEGNADPTLSPWLPLI